MRGRIEERAYGVRRGALSRLIMSRVLAVEVVEEGKENELFPGSPDSPVQFRAFQDFLLLPQSGIVIEEELPLLAQMQLGGQVLFEIENGLGTERTSLGVDDLEFGLQLHFSDLFLLELLEGLSVEVLVVLAGTLHDLVHNL